MLRAALAWIAPHMSFLVAHWRIILSVVMLLVSFIAGRMNGQDAVQRQWDIDIHIRTKAALEQIKANEAIKTKLEATRNENIKTIDMLAASNRELNKRLRLPAPPCTGRLPDTVTTGGGEDQTSASGVVSAEVSGRAEEALNQFDGAYANEAERADKLIEHCRVVVDWANTLQ